MPLTIRRLEAPTDDAAILVSELETELAAEYRSENRHGLNIDRLFRPHVSFFVAYCEGTPVGCGGVAFENALAELKRMYVRPHARGTGVADAILARLFEEASSRGFTKLVLETGDAQAAALRFYERNGFSRCGAFGEYAQMSPESIRRSVFFEKLI